MRQIQSLIPDDIVSRPEVDVIQIEKGQPFIFTATVAVKPEVEFKINQSDIIIFYCSIIYGDGSRILISHFI